MKRRSAFTIMEVLVVAAIFLLMIAVLTPFMRMAKVRTNKINCADNLMRISIGLHKYAAEHNDSFPADLAALYPVYVTEESAFDCPASKTKGMPAKPDYDYVQGLSEFSSPKEVIVKDADGNHKKLGRNVLRVDGSVDWVSAGR